MLLSIFVLSALPFVNSSAYADSEGIKFSVAEVMDLLGGVNWHYSCETHCQITCHANGEKTIIFDENPLQSVQCASDSHDAKEKAKQDCYDKGSNSKILEKCENGSLGIDAFDTSCKLEKGLGGC